MFEESPNSMAIWKYFDKKFGQLIAPIGLAKVCSVLSAQLVYERYSTNIFTVAPTRQFKSITSVDASKVFPKNYNIQLGSDFTIFDIYEHHGRGKNGIHKKCLMINDATVLFASKGKRSKDRLVGALGELISDGFYRYGDRLSQFILKGRVSVVMNMTSESYNQYSKMLLGSSFLERFITLFYAMPWKEQYNFMKEKEKRVNFNWKDFKPDKILFKRRISKSEFLGELTEIASTAACLAMKSFAGTDDQLKSLASAHAALNSREKMIEEDVFFIKSLMPYFSNPFAPNEFKIVRLAQEGRSQKDICLLLDKDVDGYQPYVSKVIKTAKERGLVSI